MIFAQSEIGCINRSTKHSVPQTLEIGYDDQHLLQYLTPPNLFATTRWHSLIIFELLLLYKSPPSPTPLSHMRHMRDILLN